MLLQLNLALLAFLLSSPVHLVTSTSSTSPWSQVRGTLVHESSSSSNVDPESAESSSAEAGSRISRGAISSSAYPFTRSVIPQTNIFYHNAEKGSIESEPTNANYQVAPYYQSSGQGHGHGAYQHQTSFQPIISGPSHYSPQRSSLPTSAYRSPGAVQQHSDAYYPQSAPPPLLPPPPPKIIQHHHQAPPSRASPQSYAVPSNAIRTNDDIRNLILQAINTKPGDDFKCANCFQTISSSSSSASSGGGRDSYQVAPTGGNNYQSNSASGAVANDYQITPSIMLGANYESQEQASPDALDHLNNYDEAGPGPLGPSSYARIDPKQIRLVFHDHKDEDLVKQTLREKAKNANEDPTFIIGPPISVHQKQRVVLPPPLQPIVYILLKKPVITSEVQYEQSPESEKSKPMVFITYDKAEGVKSKHIDLGKKGKVDENFDGHHHHHGGDGGGSGDRYHN